MIDIPKLLAEALDKGQNPRVHPNGFVQLDLAPVEKSWDASKKRGHSGASRRLHIWNPPGIELPHQKTVNEIHDHVFDMKSTVVRGLLYQRLYWFVVGAEEPPSHELYRAVYDSSNSRLEALGVKGQLRHYRSFPVGSGDSYTQPAFSLHDSDVPPGVTTITVMEKTEIHEGDASVVCKLGHPPDNDFNRATAVKKHDLWVAIRRSFEE